MWQTWGYVLLLALAGARSSAQPPASQPARSGPVQFAPGVWIDWQQRAVELDTHVVLREGPLEFLACFGGKEHESILRFEGSAAHIYMALGLVGLTPGHPPVPDDSGEFAAPEGDLVELSLRWEAEGLLRTADAWTWLATAEYGRPPMARPWIFAGSLRLPDQTLAADQTGVGVALVDFPDSLLCMSRRYPSRYGALWAEANAAAIPPVGTPVRLVAKAAAPRTRKLHLDHRGAAWVDGRCCDPAELLDVLLLELRLAPGAVFTVETRGTLDADVNAARQALHVGGVSDAALRFQPQPAGAVSR